MILSALNAYYERLRERDAVPPPGYSAENISYALILDRGGHLVDIQDIRNTSGKRPQPLRLFVPQSETRTSGVKSLFLWDKTSYALGVSTKAGENDKLRTRTKAEHDAFKELHRMWLGDSDDAGLASMLAFLEKWQPAQFTSPLFPEDMLDANVVFRLDGEQQFIHDRPAARALQAKRLASADSPEELCLVTGSRAPTARLHFVIKGVDGAQSSGAHIISFNKDAFTSYGKSQGANAPVSERAAFAYATALNHLLRRDEQNRQRLRAGDTTMVFWAQAPDPRAAEAAESLFAALAESSPSDEQEAKRLHTALESAANGRAVRDFGPGLHENTRFFVLGLAPNASRLSVRFWFENNFGYFIERLAQHHADLSLEPPPWKTLPALWRLLHATAAQGKTENIPPQLAGEMMRAILTGAPYPSSLLAIVVMRMRADNHGANKDDYIGIRAALCKAVLTRRARLGTTGNREEDIPVSLDKQSQHPGYRLGRLFAALEHAQQSALGRKVNATIRDRYYGAASATPASVFPMLLRNTTHHLSRLRKDGKGGLATVIERDMAEIIDGLDARFPRSLRMEDQGRFAIGYYHQTQDRYTRRDDANKDEKGGQE